MSQAATCWSNLRSTKVRRGSMAGAPSRQRQMARAAVAVAPAVATAALTTPIVSTAPVESPNAQFEGLMKHCNQRVYRLALRITRNHQDAEDARQETFLKAYRHLDQFEGRSRFTTWISRIAINEGLMNLRKRNDSRRVPLDEIAETAIEGDALVKLRRPIEDPEVSFTRRQLRGALNAAIAALRPLYRDVFVLRTVEELSTSETAKTLGLTVSTVKTRLRRARIELRAYLASCGQMVQNAGALAGEGSSEAA